MTYRVLLVDDELPSLRFLQNIIEKYAPDFQVADSLFSSEKAAEYLKKNRVDVLITDIQMQGMNGIQLAKLTREIQPDIRIVIISGYAEFDYAQSAIEAGVDKYLLKPVDIRQMRDTLVRLKMQLDERHASHAAAILPAIACDMPYSQEDIRRYWQGKLFRFVLIHWGGVDPRQRRLVRATSLLNTGSEDFYALRGRSDEEQILIFPYREIESFLTEISLYMVQHAATQTWTVVYRQDAQPITQLSTFLKTAFEQLHQSVIIGRHQILPHTRTLPDTSIATISPSDMNQLSYFASTGKYADVKNMLQDVAVGLDKQGRSQMQVFHLLKHMVLGLVDTLPNVRQNYDSIINTMTDIFLTAPSYREVFARAYEILFDEEDKARNRKLNPRELFDFIIRYVKENYASPLSVQSVCDEIGISQTYLNRLFRRYCDTTFNNCLMRTRMEAAMKLLEEKPGMLLRDVAACVGYEDSSYFSKVFHKYTGQNPSQYTAEPK